MKKAATLKKVSFIFLFCLISTNLHAEKILRISTTTSTENSGLLDVLNPVFEKQNNVRVDVIAVGTGKALKLGKNGDVDVVFVHAPEAELDFIAKGFGINRKAVMHNDFIFIGLALDPGNIKQSNSAIEVMQKINQNKLTFISRGDDSGTHKKEKKLWQLAGIKPSGDWYIAVGQGMGAVLQIADEKRAYTLSDRGTYIAYQDKIDLDIIFEGDKLLFNPYHIMAVNPEKHPHVHYNLAQKYIAFVTGKQGQRIIANYKMKGQQLFYPDALPEN